ncbi:MAG: HlyC/CorC family transporter [Anaeromyxobacter sp.]|nr:HlyC/CorC family transporter [Anaeromyxobacter sp.]MBL0277877.1 HlyC/CorC family transporter [Anaeromyxobacter sp.]
MDVVETWKWLLALAFLVSSAFCSGTETALTALGDARARQLRESGGRRARLLGLWVEHPERVLATLLIGNTLVNVGAGALAGSVAVDLLLGHPSWSEATTVAVATAVTTVVVLFLGEIIPKTVAKRHPVQVSMAMIPLVQAVTFVMWPISSATTRATSAVVKLFGGGSGATPAVTSEEIEYLIEMGTREGVLDEVKEELLNSVLEFADRVVKEIMIPRTRMVAIDRTAAPEELLRVVTENPYSRMPVYEGSVDNVVGVLMVRDIVSELRRGPIAAVRLDGHLKAPFFVPEQMKISRLLKEMQRRHVHLAVVVDEFGGTSGIVTLEDVLEEIVGEIQDEGDAEAAPVKLVGEGTWLADAAIPLHDLEEYLNAQPAPAAADEEEARRGEVGFPEEGDYGTLGGFVTATAGRVPPVGAVITWEGLSFTVRGGDERRVTKVEITRRGAGPGPAAPQAEQPGKAAVAS